MQLVTVINETICSGGSTITITGEGFNNVGQVTVDEVVSYISLFQVNKV